ncbi:MAG TPA: Xaa-Pro peptidase family protein [Thermoanaerobaculia bacterium]
MMKKLSAALITLVIAFTAAAQDVPLFTSDFPPEEFAARRAKVYAAIGENAIAIIQGAPSPENYARFRQSNEMYYLSGIEAPHAYLVIDGGMKRSALYLPHRNEQRESSEGKVLSAEDAEQIRKLSGIEAVFPLETLAEHLGRYARSEPARALYTPFQPAEGTATSRDLALRRIADTTNDPWDGRGSREATFLATLRARFPQYVLRDLTPELDKLRLIKSPREIALITKATRLSGLALMEAMRSTEPGILESELDAVAKYIYYRNGAQGDAYYSLIANGTNAYFPHYNAGKTRLRDGDLLLMDYAPDVGYYMSDVTRQWPVNGKFSPDQRDLYNFYLGCYRAILDAIRPGLTPQQVKKEALVKMEQILARSKFSKEIYTKGAKEFVDSYRRSSEYARGGLGHWVGMATHDVGNDTGPLRPGMVFTIEPALRIPEERIYIRLEDLIVITEKGKDVPSLFVPLDIEGIEKVMQEEGMLQKYPVDK